MAPNNNRSGIGPSAGGSSDGRSSDGVLDAGALADTGHDVARALVSLVVRDDAPAVPGAVTQLMERAVAAAVAAHAPSGHWLVDLTLAGDEELAQLNATYRQRSATTDVLSFPQWSPEAWPAADDQQWAPGPLPLGDVVVNLAAAARSAELYGHSLARECAFLAVHGTLHLLGYDHAEETAAANMAACTEAVLRPLGLQRGE